MRTIFLLSALWLAGCETAPVLTNVVSAPVRISCVSSVPDAPPRLTPCKAAERPTVCLTLYEIDVEVLQTAVDDLTKSLKACQ